MCHCRSTPDMDYNLDCPACGNLTWPKVGEFILANGALGVSHHLQEIVELKADRDLAVEYLKAAVAAFDNQDERVGGLLALRALTEAYGDIGGLAAEAGTSPESLDRIRM